MYPHLYPSESELFGSCAAGAKNVPFKLFKLDVEEGCSGKR